MTKRMMVAEDLFELSSVTNPQISPDGSRGLFVKTDLNKKENTYVANLFHVDLHSSEVTQWTFGESQVSSPKWSMDGKQVAFLSNREEHNELFVLQASGGEAKKLTAFAQGVSSFHWSPCGNKIWVTAEVKEGKTFTDQQEIEDEKKPEPVRVTKLNYKADSIGLLPQGLFSHIGVLDIQTGEVEQFTAGNHDYTLQAISHDGKQLVMSVNRAENLDFEFRQPLLLVDIETKKETVIIDEEGYYRGGAFSFDDAYIAFVGANRQYSNSTHDDVFVYSIADGTTLNLTEYMDAPVGDHAIEDVQQGMHAPAVVWTEANDLYFQLSTMGDVRLYYASLDGAVYPATPENEHVYGYDITRDGTVALIAVSQSVKPGELFKHHIMTGEREAITSFNEPFLEEVKLVEPEKIVYEGATNWSVHGWLMKPACYTEGEKYPLIVQVHGGPHVMYANTFFHEMQLLAAQGYGVLYVNPRGSHGYSQEFVNAVRGNYGSDDYEDIMAGLEFVTQENEWIDREKLGITGGSYGGFMTNWIVGHTNKFKAAVTQRSISNWISFFGASDIGYFFNDWQLEAGVTDIDKLWAQSPLKYAAHVETPLLILHSEKDFRCPIEQAEQLFNTLKSMKKEVEFVRFPDGDHNLSRTGLPNLRIARLEEITSWFKRYL